MMSARRKNILGTDTVEGETPAVAASQPLLSGGVSCKVLDSTAETLMLCTCLERSLLARRQHARDNLLCNAERPDLSLPGSSSPPSGEPIREKW